MSGCVGKYTSAPANTVALTKQLACITACSLVPVLAARVSSVSVGPTNTGVQSCGGIHWVGTGVGVSGMSAGGWVGAGVTVGVAASVGAGVAVGCATGGRKII